MSFVNSLALPGTQKKRVYILIVYALCIALKRQGAVSLSKLVLLPVVFIGLPAF
jgi:hypothetical protein